MNNTQQKIVLLGAYKLVVEPIDTTHNTIHQQNI